jgi:penicillin-binding protein 2
MIKMLEVVVESQKHERVLFIHRAIVSIFIVITCIISVLLRLVWLQVNKYEHFRTLSQENRIKLEPVPPTRGLIYDANDVMLAENVSSFALELTPDKVQDISVTIESLKQLIPISDNDIKRFERLKRQRRRFDGIPIRNQLTEEEVARFAINSYRFPGVKIHVNMLRHYPVPKHSAHVLGYVGRINEKELQSIDESRYSGTSHIGKTGIEKTYENLLHGQVGMQQVEVNAKGRVLRVLEEQQPLPGHDLHLYLDLNLQEEASRAFGEENGAVVAIDPRTGGVLALVSKPAYDPNLFVTGISTDTYKELMNSPDRPLYNRALRGQYPPGSTVKPFIALAGLENGIIRVTDRVFCPGYYKLPGHDHKYRDWRKGGHGTMNMDGSIVESCDVYYYVLARNLGVDNLHSFLSLFGFGKITGIDLSGELEGLLPSREWKRLQRKATWYPGETLIMGIGQGYVLATPLQLASATAALAAYGNLIRPKVVRAYRGPSTNNLWQELPTEVIKIPHQAMQNWQAVITAMQHVVESPRGTAKKIRTNAYNIAGKTGTAQVFTVRQNEEYNEAKITKNMRDHALFVAFAPVEEPRIAIAVLVEHGGHGGAIAAPIARRVMDRHLLRSTSNVTDNLFFDTE